MSVFSRLSAVPRWARRPVLPALLLAAAVAVSVAQGQPSPADRASGVSVPVRAAITAPSGLGNLLLVSGGALTSYDVQTGATQRVPLPRGELALRAWPMRGTDVVLTQRGRTAATPSGAHPAPPTPGGSASGGAGSGHAAATPARTPSVPLGTAPPAPVLPRAGERTRGHRPAAATVPARTSAFAIPHGGTPVRLGSATAVVPAPDGAHVWLLQGDVARLVGLDGSATGRWVRVPPGYWLVGATRRGPIATIRRPEPLAVLLPADGALPHWLANAEALDVADGVVLLREEHRIGSLQLATSGLHWLPALSAVQITGPGTLSPGSGAFAVVARVNDHARLVVGPVEARSDGQLQVVALEGGAALDHPPAPVWTDDGRVLAVRPDGRMVVYAPGDAQAAVLSVGFQADGLAAARPASPGH